jgi:hypothetical protein
MPSIQYVFLDKARIPTVAELQSEANKSGIDLTFDPRTHLVHSKGYFACKLDGVDSGFELENYTAEGLLHEDPGFRKFAGTHDWCFAIRFRSDRGEPICLKIFCAAMIRLSDATSIFEDSDEPDKADQLVARAIAEFAEFRTMPKPPPRTDLNAPQLAERELEKPWWKFW